jgi:hypothetical protein
MRALVGAQPPSALKVSKVSAAEFPALIGQSVSYAVLQFPLALLIHLTFTLAQLSSFSLLVVLFK